LGESGTRFDTPPIEKESPAQDYTANQTTNEFNPKANSGGTGHRGQAAQRPLVL
jgi:hypothetical protein